MTEIWVSLRDEEGDHGELYQVSSLGRVKALPRKVLTKGGATAQRREKILSACLHRSGYLVVGYTVNGRQKQRLVNRLVAFSFHGDPPAPDMEAAHGDGDRTNNFLNNIRWATKLENAADKKIHGTDNRGATNPRSTMRESQVDIIIDLAAVGERQIEIAESLGVHKCAVNHILTGRTWSHHTGINRQ